MPIVSIITPTYNHEAYIGHCIESVLAQTFTDWEMWIVDDGSTDRTAEIIRSYRDPRIRRVSQVNKGLSRLAETYNTALNQATGEVIAILEGDDYWPEDKLARQVPDFDDPGIVLSSGVTLGDLNGELKPIHQFGLDQGQLTNTPVGRGTAALCHPSTLTFTFPVSTLIRASTLREIGGFQQPPYLPLVDLPTLIQVSTRGRFAWHDEPCGIWRRHPASATSHRFSIILDGAERYVRAFLAENPEVLNQEVISKLNRDWDAFRTHRFLLLARDFQRRGKKTEASRAVAKAAETAWTRNQKLKIRVAQMVLALRLPWDRTFGLFGAKDWSDTTEGGDRFIRDEMIDAT